MFFLVCKGALIWVVFPKKKLFETKEAIKENLFLNKIKFQSEIAFDTSRRIENYHEFSTVCSQTPLATNREKPQHLSLAGSVSWVLAVVPLAAPVR